MQGKPRLLVVDDELRQLDALCIMLEIADYDVTGCRNPTDALAALREHDFDVLLSDLKMPGLDGVSLVREAVVLRPDLVAIVMTGHGSVDSAVDAMQAGVLDYIQKPFRISEIRPVIARALEVRRLRVTNSQLLKSATEANAQLVVVNLELDALAGRVAHDLQAVMQVTEGFAEALQASAAPKLDDKERHYLRRIVDTSARGNRLVHDLLAFARLGVSPIECRPENLSSVLHRAQQFVEAEAQDRRVEWDIGELPTLPCDASLLQQVFANLLSNALKYTRGSDPARIRVEAESRDSGYEIRILDNGVGFDPTFADRLFKPFERLHGAAQFEGNGMGLANVKRIIERHGGEVRAHSAPGEGALFAFTLPGVGASGTQAGAAASTGPAPADAAKPGALRVLLIDDDPTVLMSLTNMLEMDGHLVGTAAGGQIGVDAFERALQIGTAYDVVITDYSMPHMNGGEVARAIKAAQPRSRVIVLTGWRAPLESLDDWHAHVDDVLSKPARLAELRKALAAASRPGV